MKRASSSPDQLLLLLLSLTGIHVFCSQLFDMFQHQQQTQGTCGGDAAANISNDHSRPGSSGTCFSSNSGDRVGASSTPDTPNSSSRDSGRAHSPSSVGAGSSSTRSSRSSSGHDHDPWEAAEAVLLCRADMLASEAKSAAQLAAILGQTGSVFSQHWQHLGYPAWLHPLGLSGPLSRTCSSGDGSSSSSRVGSSISIAGAVTVA